MRPPWIGLVVMGAVVWACADPTTAPVDRRALDRAQALWASRGITRYTIEARELCFCPPGLGQWMEITVEGDAVVASRPVETFPIAAAGPRRTVAQLFAFLAADHGLGRGMFIDAVYDAEYGYPKSISLRTSGEPPPDFGLSIETRNLRPR